MSDLSDVDDFVDVHDDSDPGAMTEADATNEPETQAAGLLSFWLTLFF